MTGLPDVCYFIVVCVCLVIVSYRDIHKHVINNIMLLALLCSRLVYLFIKKSPSDWYDALTALFTVAVIVLIATRFTVPVGAGDLKMCIVMGFCVGLKLLPFSLLLSIVSIILFILAAPKYRKLKIPFAPFAAIGVCSGLVRAFFV